MILITGAVGKLGSAVVSRLNEIINKNEMILMTTDLSKAEKYTNEGYIIREGNFDNADSLLKAFDGVKKLLIISTMNLNRFEQQKNAIDTAKKLGVNHIFYTSLAIKTINSSNVKDVMNSHFQTEEYLINSGINYTILRNTMYADAILDIVGNPNEISSIELPGGKGKVPYALRQEMGEATANILLEEGHENKIYEITGDTLYSYEDLSLAISKYRDQTIEYNEISEKNYKERLLSFNLPEFMVDFTVGTVLDIKDQQYEIESAKLSTFLGRPTKGIDDIISELTKK